MINAIARAAALTLICGGFVLSTTAMSQSKASSGHDAASLAGDWEYSINGPVKMLLHLRIGADGAWVGTIDAPSSPPQHVALKDIQVPPQVSGRILKYTWPQRGTMTEVIQADGDSMLGAQIWHRVDTSALSARDVAGDWESATE